MYLKIINTFLKKKIGRLIGFKLLIKTVKMLFGSITQEPLAMAYLNFDAIFEFLGQFTIRCIYYLFFIKMLIILNIAQYMLILG